MDLKQHGNQLTLIFTHSSQLLKLQSILLCRFFLSPCFHTSCCFPHFDLPHVISMVLFVAWVLCVVHVYVKIYFLYSTHLCHSFDCSLNRVNMCAYSLLFLFSNCVKTVWITHFSDLHYHTWNWESKLQLTLLNAFWCQ